MTAITIHFDREEQQMARDGDWDWIHELIVNALPAAAPKLVPGLKFRGRNGNVYEIALIGPDSDNPRKIVYTDSQSDTYEGVVEEFLNGGYIVVEDGEDE